MFPKPTVPLWPVNVNDTVVIAMDWFVEIVTLDICELVMFPLIDRLTVAPLSVVAVTVVEGVGVGDGVGDGVGPTVGGGVEVEVGVVVGVGVGVGEGSGVGVGVEVGESVTVNGLLTPE